MSEQRRNNQQVNVCQTCGDIGYKELLLCCGKCQISMEHRYCLRKLPEADDYICALCESMSAKQTSHKRSFQHVARNKSFNTRKQQRLLQYQKKGKVNTTLPVAMNAEIQRRESPPLQNSGSEPIVKDVLPQPCQDDNNSPPNIGNQPSTFNRDLKTRSVAISSSLVEVEAEVGTPSTLLPLETSDPHSGVQSQCIPLETSVSKPLVMELLPEAYAGKDGRCPHKADLPAPCVQEMKTVLLKSSSNTAETEVKVQASKSVVQGIQPEAYQGMDSKCPRKADPHAARVEDMKMGLVINGSSITVTKVEVQVSKSLVMDVSPESHLGKNCSSRINDSEEGMVNTSSLIAETEAKVQASKPPAKDVLPKPRLGMNSRCPRKAAPPIARVQNSKMGLAKYSSSVRETKAKVQASKSLVKAESCPEKNCSLPHKPAQTSARIQDIKAGPVEISSSIAETESKVQAVKPLVKDVQQKAYLSKNTKCLRDPSAAHVQYMKKGLAKGSSSMAETSADLQASNLHDKEALPESYLGKNSCSRKSDSAGARVQDMKKGLPESNSCMAETEAKVQASKSLDKKVMPESYLNDIRCQSKADTATACVQDVKRRMVKSSSIGEGNFEAPSVPLSTQTLPVKAALPEANLNVSKTDSHCSDVNGNELESDIKRLVNADWDKSDEVEGQDPQTDPAPYAQPIIDPVWRGYFEISKEQFGTVVAHLSNKSCLKVVEAANSMPEVFCVKTMSRLEAWPKSFTVSPPTDENIALYFFAGSESSAKGYDLLVNHIVNQDLAMKVAFDNVELLMFPSTQLPLPFRRFCGRYYLWGVFKGRKNLSVDTQVGSNGCAVSLSALGIYRSDSPESLRMSPLSPLNRSGSCPSDSSCSQKAQTSNRHFPLESLRDNTAK